MRSFNPTPTTQLTPVTLASRIRDFTRDARMGHAPTVTADEIEMICDQSDTEAQALAALEALARPRLAVKGMGAGQSRDHYSDVTDQQLKAANDYFRQFHTTLKAA